MDNQITQVSALTDTYIFKAKSDCAIDQYSIANTGSGTATVNLYIVQGSTQVRIAMKNTQLAENGIIIDKIILTKGQSLMINSDKTCDCYVGTLNNNS